MTEDLITRLLAERVMGWRAAPGRFLKSGRVWIPRWRFQPFTNVADALTLLDTAKPSEYTIRSADGGHVEVSVRIAGQLGTAAEATRSKAIARAVAFAVGLEVKK